MAHKTLKVLDCGVSNANSRIIDKSFVNPKYVLLNSEANTKLSTLSKQTLLPFP
jgi:hypothetical protein